LTGAEGPENRFLAILNLKLIDLENGFYSAMISYIFVVIIEIVVASSVSRLAANVENIRA
jgi:hypothetical protein